MRGLSDAAVIRHDVVAPCPLLPLTTLLSVLHPTYVPTLTPKVRPHPFAPLVPIFFVVPKQANLVIVVHRPAGSPYSHSNRRSLT
jgi:hypothetical protein